MSNRYYRRASETVWTKQGGGCSCNGGGATSLTVDPSTTIYNNSVNLITMTVQGRVYKFLPLKVALNVQPEHIAEITQHANLSVFTNTFAQSLGIEGYAV